MEYGICIRMDMAVRAQPAHTAEMVTQLLFGETYIVLEKKPEWLKISTVDDQYEGWINWKQHFLLSEEDFARNQALPHYMVRDTFLYIYENATHISFPIFIGSRFPMPEQGHFALGNRQFTVKLPVPPNLPHHKGLSPQQEELLVFAIHYLNAPYLWGGRTPAGIDCSAFAQLVFRSIGIALPRDASQQINAGTAVDFVEESKIGDLAFFENEEGKIVHTGIVCGYHQIIHAGGFVQINTLDETGIYNQNLKKYTHKLTLIKRLFFPKDTP